VVFQKTTEGIFTNTMDAVSKINETASGIARLFHALQNKKHSERDAQSEQNGYIYDL